MTRSPHKWRTAAPLAVLLCLTGADPSALAEPVAGRNKPVIELFTSQGCSSCPPADLILGKLAAREDVIALSFSVDYWDYLGWRDTLADPDHSKRQRAYARHRGDGQIYTPQMVIDGSAEVVGNDASAIEAAVNHSRDTLQGQRVPIGFRTEGETFFIEIGAAPTGEAKPKATLWLALVTSVAKVKVTRGENGGRTLVYHHVVRQLMPVGMWKGDATVLQLPRSLLRQADADMGVALLQLDGGGTILGAAQLPVR